MVVVDSREKQKVDVMEDGTWKIAEEIGDVYPHWKALGIWEVLQRAWKHRVLR